MADYNKPLFFKRNRVRRVYTGGLGFADFFGDEREDGFKPEEWVCSVVEALNDGEKIYKEGLSQLESGEYFNDVIKEHKKELLGENRTELGVLVKLLDSAIRLPLQVHPDKEFSRKYFHSEFGKTESWVIVGTRKDACIYFGFNGNYTKEQLREAFEADDEEKLMSMMNRIPVEVGDVYLIPGKSVHAIGKGCLLIEVQEPTDFTIQPEVRCGEHIMSEKEKFTGISPDVAYDCFDMTFTADQVEKRGLKCTPKRDGNVEKLITYDQTPCFAINRYYADTKVALEAPSIYVVSKGSGKLTCNNYEREIKKGDYFFAPNSINKELFAEGKGLELVQCCLPKVD